MKISQNGLYVGLELSILSSLQFPTQHRSCFPMVFVLYNYVTVTVTISYLQSYDFFFSQNKMICKVITTKRYYIKDLYTTSKLFNNMAMLMTVKLDQLEKNESRTYKQLFINWFVYNYALYSTKNHKCVCSKIIHKITKTIFNFSSNFERYLIK